MSNLVRHWLGSWGEAEIGNEAVFRGRLREGRWYERKRVQTTSATVSEHRPRQRQWVRPAAPDVVRSSYKFIFVAPSKVFYFPPSRHHKYLPALLILCVCCFMFLLHSRHNYICFICVISFHEHANYVYSALFPCCFAPIMLYIYELESCGVELLRWSLE